MMSAWPSVTIAETRVVVFGAAAAAVRSGVRIGSGWAWSWPSPCARAASAGGWGSGPGGAPSALQSEPPMSVCVG